MADTLCGYQGERDDILVAYLYDDVNPIERASFDAHLAACERCRAELAGLRGVRAQLGKWAPPEPARAFTHAAAPPSGRRTSVWTTLGDIPAWAQVAAALLFLGVAAGIANLDVRYDREGLTVRTGWSRNPAGADALTASRAAVDPSAPAPVLSPWRDDLAALERRLRREFHSADVSSARTMLASSTSDAELRRRLRPLLEETQRTLQREIALRVADVVREVSAQRSADLARIDGSLGYFQNKTGIELLKQREQLKDISGYIVRVSSQKP